VSTQGIWIIHGEKMSPVFQNPFNQQQPSFAPGREVTSTERYCSPISNRVVELRHVAVTVEDQGIFRTQEVREVIPALDDGTVPQSAAQIRECWRCLSLVTNSHLCPTCGREFCLACVSEVEKDGQRIKVCADCAASIQNPLWHLVKRALWG
jgi:hypothetical protein